MRFGFWVAASCSMRPEMLVRTARPRVFVVPLHPERTASAFVPSTRRQVQILIVGHQDLDAASVGGVGVVDAAIVRANEDADRFSIGGARILHGVVEERLLRPHLL